MLFFLHNSTANVAIAGFEGVSGEDVANFAEVPMRTTMCTRVRFVIVVVAAR